MALSTPEQVQLFGKSNAPAGSGGFKLTGEANDGDGFCRVWLRPLEAWDRALNPRMESDRWDARAYRKLDSAFEFVPEFTLKDLEEMAENFSFPQDADVFDAIEFNGDPVHDTVLAWARHVTGSANAETSEGFKVREPKGRYATAKGTESLDYDKGLVFSSSSPAPLGGVTQRGPVAIPASAKKTAPAASSEKPAATTADSSTKKADRPRVAPPGATPPPPSSPVSSNDANQAGDASRPPTPPPAKSDAAVAKDDTSRPPTPPPAKPDAAVAEDDTSKPPTPPPSPGKKAGVAKTTQAMSMLSDDDFGEDKLAALRERLAQRRTSKSDE